MTTVGGSTTSAHDAATAAAAGTAAPLAFGPLLVALRQRGFVIGVDHHLRLARLLDGLGGDCRPAELEDLLGPLFATDEEQQRTFHQVFDTLYPHLRPTPEPAAPRPLRALPDARRRRAAATPAPAPAPPRSWPYLLLALLLAGGLFAATVLLQMRFAPLPEEATPDTSTATGPGRVMAERPTAAVPQRPPEVARPPLAEAVDPYLETSTRLTLVALPLVACLLLLLYRRRHARLVLRRRDVRAPPFAWPLRLDGPLRSPLESDQLRAAARALRRRAAGPVERLDLARTITATIAAAGRVELRYRPVTKLPEYLVLIDRGALGDHRAGLADELVRALEGEGVFVHRCFYDGDPRSCRAANGRLISLQELRDRHDDHRLLLFGSGDAMLDPLSGRLADWSELLLAWRDRAILTPLSPQRWGLRELALAGRFVVLPGTLAGIEALTQQLASEWPQQLGRWLETGPGAPPEPVEPSAELVEALRSYLGAPAFQWLCACAVHPELQWNLTLYLATLPEMGPGLLDEENLLRLVRLPWFHTGRLPGRLRSLLIEQLEPRREAAVRSALAELLERHPPPAGTVAADGRELQLALHQAWLGRADRNRRAQARRRLRSFPPSRWRRDEAALRMLETMGSSALDLVLPRRLTRTLFRDGIPIQGLRVLPLLLLAILASGALWLAVAPLGPAGDRPEQLGARELPRPALEVTPPPPTLADRDSGAVAPAAELPTEEPPALPPTASEPLDAEAEATETVVLEAPSGEDALEATSGPTDLLLGDVSASGDEADTVPTAPAPTTVAEEALEPPPSDLELATAEPPVATRPPPFDELLREPERTASARDERVRIVSEGDHTTVVIPLDAGGDIKRITVPLDLYLRPVSFTDVELRLGHNWETQRTIDLTVNVASAGEKGHYGTAGAELLDAAGTVLASSSNRKKLDEGSDRIKVGLILAQREVPAVRELRLVLAVGYEARAMRRLANWLGWGEEGETPGVGSPRERGIVVTGATVTLPIELEETPIELLVDPMDFHAVSSHATATKVTTRLLAANPSDHDRRVTVQADLLDAQGRLIARATGSRQVEEGKRSKAVEVSWRLTPEDRAAAATVRLTPSSELD